jgi:hypothetical protein
MVKQSSKSNKKKDKVESPCFSGPYGAKVDEFSLNFSKKMFGRHEWSYYEISPEEMLRIFEDPFEDLRK